MLLEQPTLGNRTEIKSRCLSCRGRTHRRSSHTQDPLLLSHTAQNSCLLTLFDLISYCFDIIGFFFWLLSKGHTHHPRASTRPEPCLNRTFAWPLGRLLAPAGSHRGLWPEFPSARLLKRAITQGTSASLCLAHLLLSSLTLKDEILYRCACCECLLLITI